MQDVLESAANCARQGGVVALTGAGLSVDSGIPDFRSPHGLWTVYNPSEYATLEAFLSHPEKAWDFFRALGKKLHGKAPNPGHLALAELEQAGILESVITQNIDGLHQLAGSREVIEVHGEARTLHCLQCQWSRPSMQADLEGPDLPLCQQCRFPLKPNVVLFNEWVRGMERVHEILGGCRLLMVVGTSGEVYPVAGLPLQVLNRGGKVAEFNQSATHLSRRADFFFEGSTSQTLPDFAAQVRASTSGETPNSDSQVLDS